MSTPAPKTVASPATTARPALLWLLVLLVSLLAGGWWLLGDLSVRMSVNEGRAVADMSENVGRWASQYGGVHVRTIGLDAKLPGAFLTRSAFTPEAAASDAAVSERMALQKIENYYWKNPALIQREVADTVAASGSRVQYRMTARTVLNPANAPTARELKALDALQAAPGDAKAPQEYWVREGNRLLYARAVIAQDSCLRCHGDAKKAPEFLRTNAMFNGGGGFGYVSGQPVGIIAVNVPMRSVPGLLEDGLGLPTLAAGVAGLVALLALAVLLLRRR